MTRRLLNLLTALSLLLCVAVAVLWVRDVGYSWNTSTGAVSRVYGPRVGFWLEWGPADGLQPIWSLSYSKALALALAFPLLRAIRSVSVRRQRRPGVCERCAYNLTGNVSGVCPECGTPAKVPA